MHQSDFNLQQWRNEIETFVTETNRQLDELHDQLAQQLATGKSNLNGRHAVGSDADSTDRPDTGVDQQLAFLEQSIAVRLQQQDNPASPTNDPN